MSTRPAAGARARAPASSPPGSPRSAAARRRPADAAPGKLVGALVGGLAVLRHLAGNASPLGVTRIARELGLNASTCFNLLKTLVHEGLVDFDEVTKTYRISLGLVELARGALDRASVVRMMRADLEAIAAGHRVTATLWQRSGEDRVTLVDLVDTGATMRVHMSIGQRLPTYIAALGRCMAAHSTLTKAQLRARFAQLRWEDPPRFDDWHADAMRAREQGWAVDRDRYVKGVTTVSAPVLDAEGRAVMAISAVGFSGQFDRAAIRRLGEALRERAGASSRALSGRVDA